MTMTLNSTITLSNDGVQGDLTFASGSHTAGTLTIDNWVHDGDSGTHDRIYFSNDPGSTFLNNITFTGFGAGAVWSPINGEISPSSVPEPGTIFGSLLLAFIGTFEALRRRKSA
jgi:hypothetical protein